MVRVRLFEEEGESEGDQPVESYTPSPEKRGKKAVQVEATPMGGKCGPSKVTREMAAENTGGVDMEQLKRMIKEAAREIAGEMINLKKPDKKGTLNKKAKLDEIKDKNNDNDSVASHEVPRNSPRQIDNLHGRKGKAKVHEEGPPQGSGVCGGEVEADKGGGMERELTRQLMNLSAQVEDMKRQADPPVALRKRESPFCAQILEESVPYGFRAPALQSYDGKGDPEEHLYAFDANIQLYNLSDAVNCRMFITTLTGRARTWFTQLPRSSIFTYDQLSQKFLYHFASNKRCKRGAIHLYNIQQKEGETLRSFMQRFNDEALNVSDVSMGIMVNVLMHGLRPGKFLDSIAANPPRDMDELLREAEKFINVEEVYIMKRGEPRVAKKNDRPFEAPKAVGVGRNEGVDRRPPRMVPLTLPLTALLHNIKDDPRLNWPRKTKDTPRKMNSKKFCDFHQDKGHDTEECYHLQEEVQRLINAGHLREFVKPEGERGQIEPSGYQRRPRISSPSYHQTKPPVRRSPRRRSPERESSGRRSPEERRARSQVRPRTRNLINTISGGPSGGDTSNARRRYARRTERGQREETYQVSQSKFSIKFNEDDAQGVIGPHTDPLIISADIAGFEVRRILVDSGSSADIMTEETFSKMGISPSRLSAVRTPLMGFGGALVEPLGRLELSVTLGRGERNRTEWVDFLVVRQPSAYNIILGRPSLYRFQAVLSIFHLKLKFPTKYGVGECCGNQKQARSCYEVSTRGATRAGSSGGGRKRRLSEASEETPRVEERSGPKVLPVEEVTWVELTPGSEGRKVGVGSRLGGGLRERLLKCLGDNQDVFAWSTGDMVGISPSVMTHKLNVDPTVKPVQQKRRHVGAEKERAIRQEVERLQLAGQIEEAMSPVWLSNVVLVKKSTGQWRMCVDYTDLNKACPKDPFPLPRIDLLIDSTAGCQLLSFLDAFQGYNQVPMNPSDRLHTSFVTGRGLYCYKVMPFGLKNAGATYQRLVNMMFADQLGKTMEAYVDDMVVKSVNEADHVGHLEEVFGVMKKFGMKLNPAKCTFGVSGGKFLGYMVTHRGIEVNPQKIQAIQEMVAPRSVRDVQQLTGRVAALSRFISRSADKSLPFFRTIKKGLKFEWTEGCDKAFEELKVYLSNPPLLSKPVPGEKLFLYLALSPEALSGVLVREEEGVQKPVYYVSKVLLDTETRYTAIEKWALALVTTTRKLKPYFLSHTVAVVTDQPLKCLLTKPELSGRLAKWAVELGAYGLEYIPRVSVKAQALAEFCAGARTVPETTPEDFVPKTWEVRVDGSSTSRVGGVGVWATSPEGEEFEYAIKLEFEVTNNEAEYEAVIRALWIVKDFRGESVRVYTDSQLIAKQIRGEFEVRESRLQGYLEKAKAELQSFRSWELLQIPRAENGRADALARLGGMSEGIGSRCVTVLGTTMSVLEKQVAQVEDNPGTWSGDIVRYLTLGEIPEDIEKARQVKRRAQGFVVEEGKLYKKSGGQPMKRCLGEEEASLVLREMHEGSCGNHSGGRALAYKALRQGYYWPTMMKDSVELSRKCPQCQYHATLIHQPATEQEPIYACCPFDKWGVDLVGPMPIGKNQKRWIVVAVEYFSKWVEAEALSTITENSMINFIWKNIICRYGIPRVIVSDNGTQFCGKKIKAWCRELTIQQRFSSVGHPQTNGQVEVTNRALVDSLARRLEKARGSWVEELEGVLWAYRTTPKESTGETPYALVFGSEAVIPAEVAVPSYRILSYKEDTNAELRHREADLIEEKREQASIRTARYKEKVARRYNSRVRPRSFMVGDLVLKKKEVSTHVGKLEPRWDGPYKIIKVTAPGAYKLATLENKELPRSWNVLNLRKYYV